ncbi:hypothetical protein BH23CHL2_BH23CHL2_18340 [soil metagenome]
MSDVYPTSVPELEGRIEIHRRRLLELVDNMPDHERDEIRDPEGWSTKDHIAHLSMWERSMVYLLTNRPRHEGLGVELETYLRHDVDLINDAIYRRHRHRSWESVKAEFDAVHEELIETLRQLGWDRLQLPYSHFAPDEPGEESGEPVVYYVAGNTFFHYDEHRGWIEDLLASRTEGEG